MKFITAKRVHSQLNDELALTKVTSIAISAFCVRSGSQVTSQKVIWGWLKHTAEFTVLTLISGFRRDAEESCALLKYYATPCGNCLPTFRDKVSVPKRQ
jgi:hypothetical protein